MPWWGLFLPLALLTPILLLSAEGQRPNLRAKSRTDTNHEVSDRHPPQLTYSPFEAALLNSLRDLHNQQETRYREQRTADAVWWPPPPSWAVVYVTIGYVVVAVLQWCAIRRQANIAVVATTVAKRHADIADRALRLTERPWIVIQKQENERIA
jgi:hypothetical protein